MSGIYIGESRCRLCGLTGKESPRRSARDICVNCEKTYAIGKSVIEKSEFNGDIISVCYETSIIAVSDEIREVIDSHIRTLLKSLELTFVPPETIKEKIVCNDYNNNTYSTKYGFVKVYRKQWESIKCVLNSINDLSKKMNDDVQRSEKNGFEKGKNLLFKLNSQEFIDSLNDSAMKGV